MLIHPFGPVAYAYYIPPELVKISAFRCSSFTKISTEDTLAGNHGVSDVIAS